MTTDGDAAVPRRADWVPGVVGGVGFVSVRRGEVAGLVRAYRVAAGSARETEAVLVEAGAGKDLLGVWPGVDDAGCPVVAVVLTVAGARRLARLLGPGRGRPPPATSAA